MSMRKDVFRRGALFLAMGSLLLLLSGEWSDGKAQGTKPEPPQMQISKTLNIATHPIGSILNSVGTGLGTVLSKHLPTAVKVMPTTGPTEWFPMISTGEIDMGVLSNWDARMGRHGKEDYKAATAGKGAPIYLLTCGFPNLGGTLVLDKSDIRKGSDLKGKRVVGIYTGSGGITAQARAALANFGLKPTDIKNGQRSGRGSRGQGHCRWQGRCDAFGRRGCCHDCRA